MPVLRDTRSLRDAPEGNRIMDVFAGTRVTIVAAQGDWVQVTLVDLPDTPTGWVTASSVDLSTDIPGVLDKQIFAHQCHLQALIFGVNAHYLAAVATMRTNVVAGLSGGATGPYAFTATEWTLNGNQPQFGLNATAASIGSWSLQVAVFAIMMRKTQLAIAQSLGRQPTAAELYFAQLIGAAAGAATIQAPASPMAAVLNGIIGATAQAEGLDPACFTGRDTKYLGAADAVGALGAIATDLQAALDACRTFVSRAGDELISQSQVLKAAGAPSGINFESPVIPNGRRDMAELIAQRFVDRGYGTTQQIAAIANAIAESSLDPGVPSGFPGESSWGLFQLNTAPHAVGHGHEPSELVQPEANIRIMLDFIATSPADGAFRATTSVHDAVAIFVHDFENPDGQPEAIEFRSGIAAKLVA